jgi:hypothetical protein
MAHVSSIPLDRCTVVALAEDPHFFELLLLDIEHTVHVFTAFSLCELNVRLYVRIPEGHAPQAVMLRGPRIAKFVKRGIEKEMQFVSPQGLTCQPPEVASNFETRNASAGGFSAGRSGVFVLRIGAKL